MKEGINPAFYIWVVVQYIMVKVAKLIGVPFESGTLEQCRNVRFYQSNALEDDETLETLYKKHNIFLVNVFTYQN